MNTKIYFENLAVTTTESEIRNLFSEYGNIANINIAVDSISGRPCTFGFVAMVTPEGARAAVEFLNGKLIGANRIAVMEACPAPRRVRSLNANRSPRRRSSHLF
jgi:RNA recognition motif-containing protein